MNLLNAQNTEKSVSAIRAAQIFISTLSEEADEATKLPKLPIIPRIWKSSSVVNATKHNITTYVAERQKNMKFSGEQVFIAQKFPDKKKMFFFSFFVK